MTRLALAKFVLGRSFYFMVVLLLIESALTAATTYLIIKAGRDVANDDFLTTDLIWILLAQGGAYVVGAISWIFAERAGFGAFGHYMQRFARDNRHETKLLHEKGTREMVEPFLTGETFHIFFQLVYELEADLKLALPPDPQHRRDRQRDRHQLSGRLRNCVRGADRPADHGAQAGGARQSSKISA